MRTCAVKVQLPSECRISHSSQSTYFDAVALVLGLTPVFCSDAPHGPKTTIFTGTDAQSSPPGLIAHRLEAGTQRYSVGTETPRFARLSPARYEHINPYGKY